MTAYSDEDRQRALDVEQPAPRCSSKLSIHVIENPGRDKSPERVRDDIPAVEERGACAELAAFVPLAKQEECAGEERGFDEAEEEAGKEGADEAIRAW